MEAWEVKDCYLSLYSCLFKVSPKVVLGVGSQGFLQLGKGGTACQKSSAEGDLVVLVK
jgi:hypothetical protein